MHPDTSTDDPRAGKNSDERASTRDRDPLLADYLTKAELAAELRIHERTLDRWHTARTGPPRTEIGRDILYRRGSVRAWLAKRERSFDDHRERRAGVRRR
jgi:hypothetical protein